MLQISHQLRLRSARKRSGKLNWQGYALCASSSLSFALLYRCGWLLAALLAGTLCNCIISTHLISMNYRWTHSIQMCDQDRLSSCILTVFSYECTCVPLMLVYVFVWFVHVSQPHQASVYFAVLSMWHWTQQHQFQVLRLKRCPTAV